MTFADLLAQLPDNWLMPLAQYGLAGVMLLWFMFRTEGRLKAIEKSCYLLSKALLIQVISNPNAHPSVKEQARGVMTEIENEVSD